VFGGGIKLPFDKIHPFTERVVAFLDILGFTRLIQDAERLPHRQPDLFSIIAALDGHVNFDNDSMSSEVPEDAKPKYIFISDSIIFSTPLRHGKYDGLAGAVAKSIQIAHKLLARGYLMQGGISVGSVWHTPTNIFGTGYIDAWLTQDKLEHPQIILTDAAQKHWNTNLKDKIGNLCLPTTDGKLMLDALDPYYIQGNGQIHGIIEQEFRQYRNIISQRIDDFSPESSPGRKWRWEADYFNKAVQNHGINVMPIDLTK
jgi:hypothetical protein